MSTVRDTHSQTAPELASARSEGRNEPQRSAEVSPGAAPRATEVLERPTKRRFAAEYRRRILAEVAAAEPGQIGSILRREGLYASHLTSWRRAQRRAELAALESRKRGPKPSKDERDARIARLEREKAELERKLRKAEVIIDLQKKVSQILGIALPAIEDSDEDSEGRS
jgi:transposase